MLSHIAWMILRPLRFFLVLDGLENLRDLKKQGIILVSNHLGVTDPWRIGAGIPFRMRRVYWLAAIELYSFKDTYCLFLKERGRIKSFFIALFSVVLVRFSLTLPVKRSATNRKTVMRACHVLNGNGIIGVFPEGGLEQKNDISHVFVKIAIKTNSLILPVRITRDRVAFGRIIDVSHIKKKDAKIVAEKIMMNIYQ